MSAASQVARAAVRLGPTRYSLGMPDTGELFEFVTSARTAPDGRFRFVWTLAPGKRGPGEHTHDDETEIFEVVSGTLRIWVRGVPHDVVAGQVFEVPPGVPHRFLNPGLEHAVINVSLDGPRMEDALVPLAVSSDGRKPSKRELLRLLVGLAAFPSRPTSRFVTGALLTLIAGLRAFGIRPFQPVSGWDRDPA